VRSLYKAAVSAFSSGSHRRAKSDRATPARRSLCAMQRLLRWIERLGGLVRAAVVGDKSCVAGERPRRRPGRSTATLAPVVFGRTQAAAAATAVAAAAAAATEAAATAAATARWPSERGPPFSAAPARRSVPILHSNYQ
jgi:hypothetical protein